jgi:transketolase
MIGIAVGWSLAEDKIVFIYSLGNFPTLRCLEQIRNDCCGHNANVKIISLGSGIIYGQSGYSHFAVEDLAVMGAMPNMTIFTPADPNEAKRCLDLAVQLSGPVYIRLAKKGEPLLNGSPSTFNIGDFVEYRAGSDMCLIGIGPIIANCIDAAKILEDVISPSVIGLPVFKPLNEQLLADYLRKFSFVTTIEEHSAYGGLGSIISEIITRYNIKSRFLKLALPEGFKKTGLQGDLQKLCGLESTQIAFRIREAVSKLDKVI